MFNHLVHTGVLAPPKESHSVLDSGTSKLPDRHPEKNPHPGSASICTTLRHKVTQATQQRLHFQSYASSTLPSLTSKKSLLPNKSTRWLPTPLPWYHKEVTSSQSCPAGSFFMCFLNIQSKVHAQKSWQSCGQNLVFSTSVSNFPHG